MTAGEGAGMTAGEGLPLLSFRTSCMRNPSGRFRDEDGCPMKNVGHDGGGGGGAVTGNTALCFLS